MSEGLWRTASVPAELARDIAERHQLPIRVARWLGSRNIVTDEQIYNWKHPDEKPLSPWLFNHMDTAVKRILNAIDHRERICIVGDYDVDGVTASAIMATTLNYLKADFFCLIPHRVEDGYGLSKRLVERAKAQEASLIVTVDNGIAALEAVAFAYEAAVDVIVTDHHEPLEQLPAQVCALVHWCLADSRETAQLSGAGVAWKVAQALLERSERLDGAKSLMDWHAGLAALGALADVMPMHSVNRSLVTRGLRVLKHTTKPGWLALCQTAGVNPEGLTDRTLLWSITPRINAAGRMGSAKVALDLLLAENEDEALKLANQIELWNDLRKQETARAVAEASAACEPFSSANSAAIAIAGPWPLGVVGIVAAKLTEQYQKPVIVFADDKEEVLRGSGRAPDGFGLHETVSKCAEYLVHFGGHEAALGCAIERDRVQDFAEAFAASAEEWSDKLSQPGELALADDYLPLSEATLEMVAWLEQFAPFGPGNPEFTFYVGPVQLLSITRLGKGNHLRLKVKEGNHTSDLIWFQAPNEAAEWPEMTWIAAVVVLERNDWRGHSRAQLRIQQAFQLHGLMSRDVFGHLYRLLRVRRKLGIQDSADALSSLAAPQAQAVLDTFVELGFAERDASAYHVVEQASTRDLRESLNYQKHLRQTMKLNLNFA